MSNDRSISWLEGGLSILVLASFFAALSWCVPPDVNEAHYLVKAKHFADRSFCANDLFATSAEPHWFFYATHGWLCRHMSLAGVAILGRCLTWLLLAWGLLKLVRCFVPRRMLPVVVAAVIAGANTFGNMAGEWFVGGIEGKGYAYAFLFAGLACWIRNRLSSAVFFIGVGCAFHVVVGLWVVIALAMAVVFGWVCDRRLPSSGESRNDGQGWIKQSAILIVGGFAFLLIGLVPALAQNWGVDSQVITAASELQSLGRLSHHQLALEFSEPFWFFMMLAMSGFMVWRLPVLRRDERAKMLNRLLVSSLLISVLGFLLSLVAVTNKSGFLHDSSARLLTLYWFRLSDVLVPMAVFLNTFAFAHYSGKRSIDFWVSVISLLIVMQVIVSAAWRHNMDDPRSNSAKQMIAFPDDPGERKRAIEAETNWIKTCRWIRENTDRDSVFLTPTEQQTFKWYSHRADYVNWKDMPQDAASVLEWDRRLKLVYNPQLQLQSIAEERLHEGAGLDYLIWIGPLALRDFESILKDEGIQYFITEQRIVDSLDGWIRLPESLKQVYPAAGQRKSTFVVYRVEQ